MKAVMLAAGIGARLGKGPDFPPKILLRFDGKTLLQRHAEILRHLGFTELVLGVGHQADLIAREIDALNAADFIRTVANPDYRQGPLTTIHALRAEFDQRVVFMDGDVLYDHRVMQRLIEAPHPTCLAMDRHVRPGEDPVKICLRDDEIVDFHKSPTAIHDDFGEWIGFMTLSSDVAARVLDAVATLIAAGRQDILYEQAFCDVLQAMPAGTFRYVEVSDLPWTEIDFPHDLARAEREILPRLRALPT